MLSRENLMSEQAKSEDKSSHTTSGIAIIAILLSMFAVQDTILKPTRPPMVNTDRAFGEDARSRLWQDPFQAVEEHRKYHQAQENPSRPISEFEATIDTTHSQRQKYKIISETKGSKHAVIKIPSLDENYAYEYGREPTRVCFDNAEEKTKAPYGYSDSKAIAHSLNELHCEMEKETKRLDSKNVHVHVLAVMVPGGPYAEDKERRLRSRYAVISALAEHNYASTDPEHIDYLDFEATCKAMLREDRDAKLSSTKAKDKTEAEAEAGLRICELPDFMPYEWFRPIPTGGNISKGYDSTQRILLLWLDNDAFARSKYPLNLLGFLKKEIDKIPEKGNIKLDFSVIGPHGSDLLYKMYREVSDTNLIFFNQDYKSLRNTPIYTATATARPSHLPDLLKINPTGWLNDMITFTRTVSTQDTTVKTLLCELTLRGINPFWGDYDSKIKEYCSPEIESEIPRNKSERSHIVLIGEKDNLYTQMLTETFRELMHDNSEIRKSEIRKVHFFSYLRGLDGITSEQPSASQETKNRRSESQENKSAEIKEQRERPVGTSQLDYLIGLAGQIKQLDRDSAQDGGIKAIGITGTDTYDKLLILQALRPKFPGVIFFTTDLDARLFHPSEIKWTRNLIVASPFGLELSKEIQPSTPSFRDNFQTSTFLSARLALCAKGTIEDLSKDACSVINREKDNWIKHPRLFEIGSYGAVDLSHYHDNKSIFPSSSIKVKEESLPYFITPKIVLASVLIVLFTAVIIFIFIPREFHHKLILTTIIPMVLILCYFLIDFYNTAGGEPISLTNGISSWPSNGIKIMASMISICIIGVIYHQLNRNRSDTSAKFLLDDPKPGK